MKKIKISLLTAAILLAVGGAMANRAFFCEDQVQYHQSGTSYVPAGTLGVDYECLTSTSTCTYYLEGNSYVPCRPGRFRYLPH